MILAILGSWGLAAGGPATVAERPPIIDVHLHAHSEAEWRRQPPPNPVTGVPAPASAAEHMKATLAAMDRYNIRTAIVSGSLEAVEAWRTAAPGRILASPLFGDPTVDFWGNPLPSPEALRPLYRDGRLAAMAEIVAQYEGLSPSDPALDPYFALAEELDIPVGIHTGTSAPGTPYGTKPRFRLALGNPLLLEDLLVRRPKLRVFIMHGGAPWEREAVALMQMYPQVYMDIAVINWIGGPDSRPRFHKFLREMLAEGLGKRILFGTDQMRWPDAIGMAIDFVESADFLTPGQKRDIFHDNAARFLRLATVPPRADAQPVVVETAADHPDERAVAETVRRMLDRHDVDRWLFTRRIRVDRAAPMPRSHPVLTLDTGSLDENEILSSLLHEQFHWLALADQKRLGAVVRDLRARYPDAPAGPPDGGRDLNGTYLHLVVNALELSAMERLLGRAAAEKMLRVRPYYRWIYRTVIDDRDAIGEILARHGMVLP